MLANVKHDPHLPLIDCGLAQDYAMHGETQAALPYFEDALRIDPTYPAAFGGEAGIYEGQAKAASNGSEQARALYRKAAGLYDYQAKYGRSINALHSAATCYWRAGDLPLAEDRFRRVLMVQPGDVAERVNLAEICFVEGKREAAISELDAAAKQPGGESIHIAALMARWTASTSPAKTSQE